MEGLYISGGRARFDLTDVDERSRVSETIGRLFQVRNLSLLLGAGSTFHLGSPRIRSVNREQVAELIAASGQTPETGVDALLDALVDGPVDLERVLEQLTAAVSYLQAFDGDNFAIGSDSFPAADLHATYAALNLSLANACDLPSDDAPPDPLVPHAEFFRKLLGARRTDLPRVRVFTTNYDLVVEKALDDVGIRYLDGFRGGVTRRLDLTSYNSDLFANSTTTNGSLVRIHELVHLYKIHGSLDWRRRPAGQGLMSSGIAQSADEVAFSDLAVIYPTPAKDSDVLGYPYSDLLRIFGTTLAEPESALVVAGYGFADDHINRLIDQALGHNPTMQLLLLDPVGVVDETEGDDLDFSDSIPGQLAQTPDSRISVLTGACAAFDRAHELLPDVNPENLLSRVASDAVPTSEA